MNVDNEAGSAVALLGAAFGERGRRRDESKAWDRVHPFLSFGFSSAGQSLVASVGYVAVNAALLSKMKIRHLVGSRHMLVSGQSETARSTTLAVFVLSAPSSIWTPRQHAGAASRAVTRIRRWKGPKKRPISKR